MNRGASVGNAKGIPLARYIVRTEGKTVKTPVPPLLKYSLCEMSGPALFFLLIFKPFLHVLLCLVTKKKYGCGLPQTITGRDSTVRSREDSSRKLWVKAVHSKNTGITRTHQSEWLMKWSNSPMTPFPYNICSQLK